MLNKVKGNMYSFLNDYPTKGSNRGYTWNAIKGKCPHGCNYCFMNRFGEQKPIRFDKQELKIDLGKDNFVFIGSSCDMFADEIVADWIINIFNHCKQFQNKYLFQTKNPEKLCQFWHCLPPNSIIGTTIETNRVFTEMGHTPLPLNRAKYMAQLSTQMATMIIIEPIMDFDTEPFLDLIHWCHPQWVNIGADSQKHNLKEPSKEKINNLIEGLNKFTEVKIKKNMGRLLKRN